MVSALTERTESSPTRDRRSRRRDARKASILAAAWNLARRDGLLGISLRDLADKVDLAQPSLYSYFASKNELYDEMFAEGNRQLIVEVHGEPFSDDPTQALSELVRRCVQFATTDPIRYELLFLRPVPGFEPSAASYAIAEDFYRSSAEMISAAGVTDQADIDLLTAIISGLSNQQVANDPGGGRWVVLASRAVEMFLAGVTNPTANPTTSPTKSSKRVQK